MIFEVVCERTDLEQVAAAGRRAFTGHVTSAPVAEQLIEIYRRRAQAEGIKGPAFLVRDISGLSGAQLV